jgi:hypothetical protein
MSLGAPSLASSPLSQWSEPVSLGTTINTAFAEQQPALSKDGLSLYFMSNRPEGPADAVLDNNIWVARRDCIDCPWMPPVSLGAPVNSASNDAQPSFSRDGHFLFFVTGRVAAQGNDIWLSYRQNVHDDFAWQTPVPLGSAVNTAANDGGPSYLENDENGAPQLFFNSNRNSPGIALGGDIFVSELMSDGTWGAASEIAVLNSPGADQRPTVTPNGLEIYFWSDRDAGRGQLGDGFIWYANRRNVAEAWSVPVLAEDPINSRSSIQPFIHTHGRVETLLLVRNSGTRLQTNLDLFTSTRRRGGHADKEDDDE